MKHSKCTFGVLWITVFSVFFSCSGTRKNNPVILDSTGHPVAVQLSPEETGKAGVKLGSLTDTVVDDWVICNGNMFLFKESQIHVSAPAPGTIRSVECSTGEYVQAGSVLARLESREFITLQQEFLETENQITYYREEYKRQGELTIENATSVKRMQLAQRDYQSFELKQNALRMQLKIYGICADSLESDQISPNFLVLAPCTGYVTKINVQAGSYADLGDDLMVMAKDLRLMLKLVVPEQFLPYLKKGHAFSFWLSHDSLVLYQAILQKMAHQVDPENHTAVLYAKVIRQNDRILPGMSIRAKIKTDTGITHYIPTQSIVQEQDGSYVFIRDKGYFKKVPVITGKVLGNLTELVDHSEVLQKDSVVIKGSDYLNSVLLKH